MEEYSFNFANENIKLIKNKFSAKLSKNRSNSMHFILYAFYFNCWKKPICVGVGITCCRQKT